MHLAETYHRRASMSEGKTKSALAAQRPPLTEREAVILRQVVRQYVDTAAPVGSRALSEQGVLDLSSASIRNTMSSLEALGYLDHPHTSAGRIPTDLGYRAYVDELMERSGMTPAQRAQLRTEIDQARGDMDGLLRETSRLLGHLTHLLGVVLSPRLATGILERLEAVPLSSDRLMFVVAVRGGLVKTIVAEIDATDGIRRDDLERIVSAMNERLAGLTLGEIRRTARERIRDLDAADHTGVVRLVLHRAQTLFSDLPEERQAERGGAAALVAQPEFQEPQGVRHVLELLENDDVVVHLLDTGIELLAPGRAIVLIGQEAEWDQRLGGRYSIVKASYRLGETVGSLGVIGPKRMDYAQAVALVEGIAALLSNTDE
jgi:heat-inducible transcriptional repressor